MSNPIALSRKLVIFSIVLPLAAILGYLLTAPEELQTWVFVGVVLGALSIPVLLRWHRPLLLLSWNSGIIVFFLPGTPQLWMLMALISLGFTFLGSLLNKEQERLNVPTITWSLLFLAAVIVLTAKFTGGLGMRSLGGNVYGGRKYYYILFAIAAYFAVSLQRIPKERALLYTSLFFIGGVFSAVSNLIYFAGPNFYFLYLFFPTDHAISMAIEEMSTNVVFSRLGGFSWAGVAGFSFMLLRYGIRGVFDLRKWWRLAIFLAILVFSSLGGFRSVLIICFLIFVAQYLLEGLLRSRLTLTLGIAMVVGAAVLFPFTDRLPMSVQRSISFLPVNVNPVARLDAQASTEWRLNMWRVLWPEVPRYLWLGKGFTASPTDYYLAQESVRRGLAQDSDVSVIAGDYHSGPLSLLIPFGIWGFLGFLAFAVAGGRVLYRNYRYGDPDLHGINTFLLAVYLARMGFFLGVFGAVSSDLVTFAGAVGLSIGLNGGMARKPSLLSAKLAAAEPTPARTPALVSFSR